MANPIFCTTDKKKKSDLAIHTISLLYHILFSERAIFNLIRQLAYITLVSNLKWQYKQLKLLKVFLRLFYF